MHVLGKIIGVVEMNNSLLMGLYNIFIQQKTLGNVLAYLSSHVITLNTYHSGILVGIFLLNPKFEF